MNCNVYGKSASLYMSTATCMNLVSQRLSKRWRQISDARQHGLRQTQLAGDQAGEQGVAEGREGLGLFQIFPDALHDRRQQALKGANDRIFGVDRDNAR